MDKRAQRLQLHRVRTGNNTCSMSAMEQTKTLRKTRQTRKRPSNVLPRNSTKERRDIRTPSRKQLLQTRRNKTNTISKSKLVGIQSKENNIPILQPGETTTSTTGLHNNNNNSGSNGQKRKIKNAAGILPMASRP